MRADASRRLFARLPACSDRFAFRDVHGRYRPEWDLMYPGTCSFVGAQRLGCTQLGGETLVPATAGFGGFGVYLADLFRPHRSPLAKRQRLQPGQTRVLPQRGEGKGPSPIMGAGRDGQLWINEMDGPSGKMVQRPYAPSPGPCQYASDGQACEHVELHRCLAEQGARTWIATRMVVDWEGCFGKQIPHPHEVEAAGA